jgi:hypothetical protein
MLFTETNAKHKDTVCSSELLLSDDKFFTQLHIQTFLSKTWLTGNTEKNKISSHGNALLTLGMLGSKGGKRWIAPPQRPKKNRRGKRERRKGKEDKGKRARKRKKRDFNLFVFISHSCLHGWIHLGEG